jgi:hypothetical protein
MLATGTGAATATVAAGAAATGAPAGAEAAAVTAGAGAAAATVADVPPNPLDKFRCGGRAGCFCTRVEVPTTGDRKKLWFCPYPDCKHHHDPQPKGTAKQRIEQAAAADQNRRLGLAPVVVTDKDKLCTLASLCEHLRHRHPEFDATSELAAAAGIRQCPKCKLPWAEGSKHLGSCKAVEATGIRDNHAEVTTTRTNYAFLDTIPWSAAVDNERTTPVDMPKGALGGIVTTLVETAFAAITDSQGELEGERAWKLYMLLPVWLYGKGAKRTVRERIRLFRAGEWEALHEEPAIPHKFDTSAAKSRQRAISLVSKGRIADGKRALVSNEPFVLPDEADFALLEAKIPHVEAPAGNLDDDEHLNLADEIDRQQEEDAAGAEAGGEDPEEPGMDAEHEQPCIFSVDMILDRIKTAKSLSAPGRSGLRWEALKMMCQFSPTFTKTLQRLLTHIASGNVPAAVRPWLFGAKITTLRKEDGGVRPICPGEVIMRLLGRLIVHKHAGLFAAALQPHQVAVGTPDGALMLIKGVEAMLELDPEAVVVLVDFTNALAQSLGRPSVTSCRRATTWRS